MPCRLGRPSAVRGSEPAAVREAPLLSPINETLFSDQGAATAAAPAMTATATQAERENIGLQDQIVRIVLRGRIVPHCWAVTCRAAGEFATASVQSSADQTARSHGPAFRPPASARIPCDAASDRVR